MKPMRLVDIGNLIIKIQYPRCNGKTVVIDAINKALNELPTVDAIPVEWIRKYTEENRLYQSDDFGLYISDMIADWAERKEE